MSRVRKERNAQVGSDEQQLWQTVRTHLRSLEKLQAASTTDIGTLEGRRAQYIKSALGGGESSIGSGEEEADRSKLKSEYRKVEADLQEEQMEVSRALERLEVLLAVRDDGEADTAVKRKKRRVDGASLSPPLPSATAPPSGSKERGFSPLSVEGDVATPTTATERKRGMSKTNGSGNAGPGQRKMTASSLSKETLTSDAVSATGSNAGQPSGGAGAGGKDNYIDPARARREVLGNQLPLQKGRKVAFRQPSKNKVGPGAANQAGPGGSGGGTSSSQGSGVGDTSSAAAAAAAAAAEEEGETWIMANVIECINNDRNRYVVQDEEDPAMPTYNTTLKAVVPLPESLTTLPLMDYTAGTQVLGLYPDTSCFYRAVVRSGGPGLNGKITAKMSRKAAEVLVAPYQLEFEDDDGAIRDVPANLVVERP